MHLPKKAGNAPEYGIGAYGSGLVCTALKKKGLIDLVWLAMSRGFQGTREALNAGEFHLAQRAPAATLCGLGVDFNDPNPDPPDFGSFMIPEDIPEAARVAPLASGTEVPARSGLRLREGPGTQFDVVGSLAPGRSFSWRRLSDGWARVDVEGDGHIDGFASAGFLERA